MATNPDTTRHRHEAELAALALLPGRRYSLPSMIAAANVRPRRFRQIRPTEALKASLAAPYFEIVRAWRDERQALLDAFDQAVVLGDTSIIKRQVDASAAKIAARFGNVAGRFAGILDRIEKWNRGAWLSRVRAAAGLDVTLHTTAADVAQPISVAQDWTTALHEDVQSQTKHRLASALIAAAAASGTASFAGAQINDILAKAKRRAAGIGIDQVRRLNAGMNRARRIAAGVDSYIWNHSPHVVHPRAWHVARDGRTFRNDEIPVSDRCGVPFGCQCYETPAL